MNSKLKMLACGLAAAASTAPALVSAEPTVTPLALLAAQDYQLQARYPEWSRAIALGGSDPVLADRTPSSQLRTGPDGAGPSIRVWTSAISAGPGETITLYAQLQQVDNGYRGLLTGANGVPASRSVSAEVIGEHSGSLGTVAYADDGQGADTTAGDGIHTARFQMPVDGAPVLGKAESMMVKSVAVLENGDQRIAAGGFVFSNPAARLTGNITESIRDGNLVLTVEMEVLAPGRVHLSGVLSDAMGAPFVSAQTAGHLSEGLQSLDLSFYGLAFHERGIAGSAHLASLALTSTNGMPNAMAAVATDAHVTKPLNLAKLTALPYNDPALLEAAQRALNSLK